MVAFSLGTAHSLRDVFLLFTIPVGGGIPAGVLLAQSRGVGWVTMSALYFLSDILLAFLFEPMMRVFIWLSQHFRILAYIRDVFRESNRRTMKLYGGKPSPIVLVAIAFGVDPMTGRAVALAAGHGFITGWVIAIIGDMFFFAVVAVSTIKLNNLLGDGTWTAVIIMLCMLIIPGLVRRFQKKTESQTEPSSHS